jgi:hypothetical protein
MYQRKKLNRQHERGKIAIRREAIDKRAAELHAELAELERAASKLQTDERRLSLLEVVGIAGAVRLKPGSHRDARLNDAVGTLKAVRPTRCVVDFGELGTVSVPVDQLQRVGDRGTVAEGV